MDGENDTLSVAIEGPEAYVRLRGRGTFAISPSLKQFGQAAIVRGCRRLTLDVLNCQGMDSTFMGVIAGLAVGLRKAGGELVVGNLSPKTCTLIETLGLSHLVRMETGAAPAPTAAPLQDLPATADRRATAETMLQAHEALVAAAPANQPKFEDVLTFLRAQVGRVQDTKPEKGPAG